VSSEYESKLKDWKMT